jgi:hypothetical protein
MAAVHPIPSDAKSPTGRVGLAARPAANEPHARAKADPLVPTVFHERWWLDAVTAGQWEAAEVRHAGRCVGWMPYVVSLRRGFRVSVMPTLAHLLGPAIDAGAGTGNTRWLRHMGILHELVQQLPKLALFSQTCHPDMPDLLGFQAFGFESFVQFSAEVGAHPEAAAWAGLRDKTRNVIRRAREQAGIETLTDPGEFVRFYLSNLTRAGGRSYFDADRIATVYEAAHSRGRARIVGARVKGGRLAAAVFYAWDDRRLWYFMSTRDPGSASNGAVSLLVWEGMHMARERGLVFDFDGIAGAGAARFYAGFGARICPRLAIYRRSIPYELFCAALDALRGRRNRNHFTAP